MDRDDLAGRIRTAFPMQDASRHHPDATLHLSMMLAWQVPEVPVGVVLARDGDPRIPSPPPTHTSIAVVATYADGSERTASFNPRK